LPREVDFVRKIGERAKNHQERKEVWHAKRDRTGSNSIGERAYYMADRKATGEEKKEIRSRALEIVGEAIAASSNDTRAKIIMYIKQHGKASFEELRKEFNLNNNSLTFHLRKLQNSYILCQPVERGDYQLGQLGAIMLQFLDTIEDDAANILEKILS
jgi:predicted HTH transcriptional regulator